MKIRLLVPCLMVVIGLATSFGVISINGHKTQVGQLVTDETYNGENLSHSLDLRLAAKATYPSTALKLVKDLGNSDGLSRQVVSFAVKTDNLNEYALLIRPLTPAPASGFPVIILCHGYVNPSEYHTNDGYISDMQFYGKHGFAVIKPDFRGQGLSASQGIPEGAYYSMAYNTDVMSLISSLKLTSNIDKSRINLWGHSMGAYVALRTAVVSPDVKNLILLSGPVGSLKQIYLSYVPPSDENNEPALRIRNDIFSKFGTPGEGSKFWANASPASYLSKTKTHIQIHVGSLDQIVPTQLSADLDNMLTSDKITHQYFVYPDGKHSLQAQRSTIWSRSLEFLQKP